MRVYRKESERLKETESFVGSRLPQLGVNKKQEIVRLLFEISKKEGVSPPSIIQDIDSLDFHRLKICLIKRRFPHAYLDNEASNPYLPNIRLDGRLCVDPKKTGFYPKRIFIEKSAWRSALANRFRDLFPGSKLSEIVSLKDYLRTHRKFSIADYNKRRSTAFITYENYDFFKKCPCTKKAVGCGYNILNLSLGCIFECTYCYLQGYIDVPGIIFPANIDRFFDSFPSYKRPGMRIGTGEFSDSLMLDHLTGYSLPIVDFFRRHTDVRFEFKTKSTNIENLLKTRHSGNIVMAWSLNPQKIINQNEFLTSSLANRISMAGLCSEAGYKLAFHFDPVIYFSGWEKEYEKVIGLVFESIKPEAIAWISIGTLRFNPKIKQVIEARFPGNKILDAEMVPGFDNKLRYPSKIRHNIYKAILKMLFKHSRKLPVYLCMEDISMWRSVGQKGDRHNFVSWK